MALDLCDPCEDCNPETAGRSEDTFRPAALRALCQILAALETGPDAPWTAGSASLAYTAVTNSGTVAAGAFGVSIANVGNAAGTVLGTAFPAGAVVEFQAVEDPVNLLLKKLPAIAYNATGTTFNIAVTT